eukprot:6392069-Amphidinium_carterae.1
MDGARWDDETGVIAESMPKVCKNASCPLQAVLDSHCYVKVLYSDIPHMHWIPCELDKARHMVLSHILAKMPRVSQL